MIKIGIDYYPEHWDPSLWEDDLDRMAGLGAHAVRMGEFAWGRLEPEEGRFDFDWLDRAVAMTAERGMKVILCTPTNCAPRWLYAGYPDTVQWENGAPVGLGIRGSRCLQSPTFRKFAARIIGEMAKRYAGRPEVMAWQLDNEVEQSLCTCPTCAGRFRDWLREKYGTLEALNAAWGTDVWSGQISGWEQILPRVLPAGYQPDWYNPGWTMDWERFASWSTEDFLNFQARLLRQYDPKAVITTNCYFWKMPDFYNTFRELDVVSYDNYPPSVLPGDTEELYSNAFGLEFVRGVKQKNFWIMEELCAPQGCWPPGQPALEPGMLEGYALQAVAHGADLLGFFRWRTAKSGAEMFCHGLLDHANVPNRRMAELEHLAARLRSLPGLEGTAPCSDVAILYSQDQYYALKNQRVSDGYEYWTQLRLIQEACMGLGVNADVIYQGAELSGYRVVILPSHFITDPAVAAALEDFARRGGTAVVTCRSGVRDRDGCCITGQPLPTVFAPLCGCHVTEYDPIGRRRQKVRTAAGGEYTVTSWCDLLECDGAEPWAVYGDRFYAGTPAVTRHPFGEGSAWYVGTVGEKAFYRVLLTDVFGEQSIPVLEGVPQGVEVCTRSGGGETCRFFFNNTMEEQTVPLPGAPLRLAPLEVKIQTKDGWK